MPDYQVYHDVPCTRQPESNACWFASLSMLVRYWRERGGRGGLVDPATDPIAVRLLRANGGITWTQALDLIQRLGFRWTQVSTNADTLYGLIQRHPLIFAGIGAGGTQGHWVVFRGMCQNVLWINDPRSDTPVMADFLTFMSQAPPWNRLWIH